MAVCIGAADGDGEEPLERLFEVRLKGKQGNISVNWQRKGAKSEYKIGKDGGVGSAVSEGGGGGVAACVYEYRLTVYLVGKPSTGDFYL